MVGTLEESTPVIQLFTRAVNLLDFHTALELTSQAENLPVKHAIVDYVLANRLVLGKMLEDLELPSEVREIILADFQGLGDL